MYVFCHKQISCVLMLVQLVDHCLAKGSKDNMTALVARFPGQSVGPGGGVMARRQRRDAEDSEAQIVTQTQPPTKPMTS